VTMTSDTTSAEPRRARLDRRTAARLAATEYARYTDQLRSLDDAEWSRPTDCSGWDVRAMAAHCTGMADMAASVREQRRQVKSAEAAGGVFIDALTDLQVHKYDGVAPAELVATYAKVSRKAARARRMMPGFIRRKTMPQPQRINGVDELWTVGFLAEVVLTRDVWMHRVDTSRATGRPMALTADHDGVLVADVVAEWAGRHGQSYALTLTGPAGGHWSSGSGGPSYELDAVEFCRILAGRASGEGLLTTEVPF
jgi:uncharacterized protein (TIGR03083 family)